MIKKDESNRGDGMILSRKLQEEITEIITRGEVIGSFALPSDEGDLEVIVSTDVKNMIPLHKIDHKGTVYYIGIPKTEADL